jgi:integrase
MKTKRINIGRWDKGHSHDSLFTQFYSLYNQLTSIFNIMKDRTIAKRIIYTVAALIQLKNGVRESEAIDILIKFAETGERKFIFQPKKNNFERKVKVYDFIQQKIVQEALAISGIKEDYLKDRKKVYDRYRIWLSKNFGINSHTFRYAVIRRLTDLGYTNDQIAVFLGHKKLDTTYHYQRSYNAEKMLDEL